MFCVCVMVTSIEDGNMVPETLDNYICMVSCYIIIAGSHLMFVCVMVTSIEYGNIWFQIHLTNTYAW